MAQNIRELLKLRGIKLLSTNIEMKYKDSKGEEYWGCCGLGERVAWKFTFKLVYEDNKVITYQLSEKFMKELELKGSVMDYHRTKILTELGIKL